MPGISVLVSAKNEATRIGAVLDSLIEAKRTGLINHMLVVADGSMDKTVDVCRARSVPVLSLSQNKGKAFAFVRGSFHLAKYDPEYLVMLDADLLSFRPSAIRQLVEPMQHDSRLGMVVAKTGPIWLSGQRGIRFSRLSPLLKATHKWRRYLGYFVRDGKPIPVGRVGYGLEDSLNRLFGINEKKIGVMGYAFRHSHQPVRSESVQFIEGEFKEAVKPYRESGPSSLHFWNETMHADRVTKGRFRLLKILQKLRKKKFGSIIKRRALLRMH